MNNYNEWLEQREQALHREYFYMGEPESNPPEPAVSEEEQYLERLGV